jgi:hypothetical protein
LLDYQSSPPSRRTIGTRVDLWIVAAVVGNSLWQFGFPLFVSNFPRVMEGERVVVPWSLCLAVYLGVPMIMGAATVWPFTASKGVRWSLLVGLLLQMLACYFLFGFDALLDKAWSRGL